MPKSRKIPEYIDEENNECALMKKLELLKLLSSISYENLKSFDLCSEFGKLSLDDNDGESSSRNVEPSPPLSYGGLCRRFMHTLSPWNASITEQLKAPFIEYPRAYMDLLPDSLSSNVTSMVKSGVPDLTMGLGFRFRPGQSEWLTQELMLPESFDRLCFIKDTLGLSQSSLSPFHESMLPYSISGAGLRSIVPTPGGLGEVLDKILVEVVTYCDGTYGRFLVLVSLGIGCTVWYGFAPGSVHHLPLSGVFRPLTYNSFFDSLYNSYGFSRINFIERSDSYLTESVANALGNEMPFAEINIPASGNVLKAVGLGVMVAFFLSVGIFPDATNE